VRRALGLALTFLCAAGAAARADEPGAALPASVVIVSAHIGPHRDALGAGVIVAADALRLRALTAKHVTVWGPLTLWLRGRPYPAEVVRTFAHRDLAVVDALVPVRERDDDVRPATLAAEAADGDGIVVWGEDETGSVAADGRIVSTTYADPLDPAAPRLIAIACSGCRPGYSGGGIFDRRGRLIGILTARYFNGAGKTVAIVGEPVDASLYAVSYARVAPDAGAAAATPGDSAAAKP
jgi:S1-C subfamily serine protease